MKHYSTDLDRDSFDFPDMEGQLKFHVLSTLSTIAFGLLFVFVSWTVVIHLVEPPCIAVQKYGHCDQCFKNEVVSKWKTLE